MPALFERSNLADGGGTCKSKAGRHTSHKNLPGGGSTMVPKPTITVSQKLVEYDDASSQVMSMGLRSARRENKQCILELPNKIS